MRILLANKFFYPRGGDCIYTIGLKQLLEENGHQVAVFSMQHPENINNEYGSFWPSALEYGSKINSNYREAALRPIYSNEVKQKWNALIDKFQPDVVHLQNIHTQLSPIIARESYKRKIPVYWTLHDFKLICPAYSMLRDGKPCEKCLTDKKNVLKYRCVKNSVGGSLIAYLEALVWSRRKLEKYTTRFITPSVFFKNKMVEAGFSAEKIIQVYNFTEKEKFIAETKKENYYVYLGRLSAEKGIQTLLKVAERMPENNLKVIGDGPLRERLETNYKNNHIEFLGYQPWEKIKPVLGKARFMVLPSECYENNPLSIIESFAVGTPVLGSNIGGIPELIDPEKNGMFFSPGDENDLFLKINQMMTFQDWDYLNISGNASEKFNTGRFYKQIMDCYSIKN